MLAVIEEKIVSTCFRSIPRFVAKEQSEEDLVKEIQKASVICIVYAMNNELSIDKVRVLNGSLFINWPSALIPFSVLRYQPIGCPLSVPRWATIMRRQSFWASSIDFFCNFVLMFLVLFCGEQLATNPIWLNPTIRWTAFCH